MRRSGVRGREGGEWGGGVEGHKGEEGGKGRGRGSRKYGKQANAPRPRRGNIQQGKQRSALPSPPTMLSNDSVSTKGVATCVYSKVCVGPSPHSRGHARLPRDVVALPLLRIAQHLIGLAEFLQRRAIGRQDKANGSAI